MATPEDKAEAGYAPLGNSPRGPVSPGAASSGHLEQEAPAADEDQESLDELCDHTHYSNRAPWRVGAGGAPAMAFASGRWPPRVCEESGAWARARRHVFPSKRYF